MLCLLLLAICASPGMGAPPPDVKGAKCMDLFPKECPKWARAGECTKKDARANMAHNCFKTCGRCCIDDHAECEKWVAAGECDKNPAGMHKYCQKSCGICCDDVYADCPQWADAGECKKNKKGMSSYCKKSCNLCNQTLVKENWPHQHFHPRTSYLSNSHTDTEWGAKCKDLFPKKCPDWARRGECTKEATNMAHNCFKTCGRCCMDDRVECQQWANAGECKKNPQGMHKLCQKSCGLCCDDVYEACPQWARAGECKKNKGGMHDYCKKSCNLCEKDKLKESWDINKIHPRTSYLDAKHTDEL